MIRKHENHLRNKSLNRFLLIDLGLYNFILSIAVLSVKKFDILMSNFLTDKTDGHLYTIAKKILLKNIL